MLTGCAECGKLWSAYHAAAIEETHFQGKLAAAKLKGVNPELIAVLSAQVKTLSLIVEDTPFYFPNQEALVDLFRDVVDTPGT
jgi:hypothetical protein